MNSISHPTVMIVEDDQGLRTQLRWTLSEYQVHLAADRAQALDVLSKVSPQVVILDLGLPPDPDNASEGLNTLRSILARKPLTKVIVASGNEERVNALEAISAGAYDFYPKPVDPEVLKVIIQRAWNTYRLQEEVEALRAEQTGGGLRGLIAGSAEMLKVCRVVERVATADVGVLLTGESGTGKDVLARALHEASSRRGQPFVPINCAAIPETLLESELFGHEKGAFTGATRQVEGKIELAHRGTLFLDEIGDMPLALQAKLLRFLQDKEIVRVGGRKPIGVDVRVVAATNKNLAVMMAEGQFREDLFYRLNEVGVHVPPLRERVGDSVLIANFLLKKLRTELDRNIRGFSPEALAAIDAYSWPGNVRELENRLKQAIVLTEGSTIDAEDLNLPKPTVVETETSLPNLHHVRAEAERQAVVRAIAYANNNIAEAARLLGITRPTLYDLLKTHNIRRGEHGR